MRSYVARVAGSVCLCLSVAGNTATAADCGPKVEAAFERLQTSGQPYRIETVRDRGQQGPVELFEVVPPDRMRLKYRGKEGDDWVEFVRVGNRMWDQENELPGGPADVFDQLVERLGRPFGAFECLGHVRFADKTYTGYRGYQLEFLVRPGQAQTQERAFWRTVLVDQQTGLLAYEIATSKRQLDKPTWQKHYTYSKDIMIDPPVR